MRTSTKIALLVLVIASASCNKTKDWTCTCTERGTGGAKENFYFTQMKKNDAKTKCTALETTTYVEDCKLD